MAAAAVHLRAGRFVDGWALYESRWDFSDYPGNRLPIPVPRARSIADIAGRAVLLWHEQGRSDTLLMLRFVPAITRTASRVVVAVQPGLKPLAASLRAVEAVSDGDAFETPDCTAPLMSLPHLLRTRIATIPAAVPYLQPPQPSADIWRERLGPSTKLRVGLAGLADPSQPADTDQFATLFSLPGIEFHVLQSRMTVQDRAFLGTQANVHVHAGALDDLGETAALAQAMDLVITTDTECAHLAGALGLPVWIALPANAHWVWMTDRSDSPWYPTARLFRQANPGDWTPVITGLREALWQRRPSIIL
jgi:hypothetical protein